MTKEDGHTELIQDNKLNIALLTQSVQTIDTNVKRLLTSWEGNGNIGYKTKIENNIKAVGRLYWVLSVFTVAIVLAVVLGG